MHERLLHNPGRDTHADSLWPDDVINAAFWVWAATLGAMIVLTCWLFCFPLG